MVQLDMLEPEDAPPEAFVIKDHLVTDTSEEQEAVEDSCRHCFARTSGRSDNLHVAEHISYLRTKLEPLPYPFVSLDASHPWLVYWPLNGLSLLGTDIDDLVEGAVQAILACISPDGGFGGGNRQLSHLAATYASVNALALTGDEAAWAQLDTQAIYKWMLGLKAKDGSFAMSDGGETDPRSTYCALATAALLDILTPELVAGVGDYIRSCQTYEGGFSNVPLTEAHGGYAFCALASLCLIGRPSETIPKYSDVDLLVRWLSRRQYGVEGGFSGRTNKLVDVCYSHWVGGCWALVEAALGVGSQSIWDREALQRYIKCCCQEPAGGLRDKPGKRPDAYHTNYALCGLSAAQYKYSFVDRYDAVLGDYSLMWSSRPLKSNNHMDVVPINPVHVLPEGAAEKFHAFFRSRRTS
jgi:protein farnesyltransferase subunit beta